VNKYEFKETLLQAIKQAGIETELRNTVFHWVRSHNNYDNINGYSIKEPLAYLRKAQVGFTGNYLCFYKRPVYRKKKAARLSTSYSSL
jgi:hypothetical protein